VTSTPKKTLAVPAEGVELTVVGDFPKPTEWDNLATELAAHQKFAWYPHNRDLLQVARTPWGPGHKNRVTEVHTVRDLGELFSLILDVPRATLAADGNFSIVAKRAKSRDRLIRRLNIIGHGSPNVMALRGDVIVEADGTANVSFGAVFGDVVDSETQSILPREEALKRREFFIGSGVLSSETLSWLMGPLTGENGTIVDGTDDFDAHFREVRLVGTPSEIAAEMEKFREATRFGRYIRDLLRTCFHPDGEILLFLCKGAANEPLQNMVATVFMTRILGYRDEIRYQLTHNGAAITGEVKTFYKPRTKGEPIALHVDDPLAGLDGGSTAKPMVRKSHGYPVSNVTEAKVPMNLRGLHVPPDRIVKRPTKPGPIHR